MTSPYLGPAVVRAIDERGVVVQVEAQAPVVARLALFIPYRPKPRDVVLVTGDGTGLYVIGVIQGRGRVELSSPRGARIAARSGRLRLSGGRGVTIAGRRWANSARRISISASRRGGVGSSMSASGSTEYLRSNSAHCLSNRSHSGP